MKLNSTLSVQVGSIGFLQLENSGNIIFSPNNIIDYLPQNIGLTELNLPRKNKNKRSEITISLPSRRIYKYVAVILMILGLFLASPRVSDVRISDYASFVPKFTEKYVEKVKEVETVLPEAVTEKPVEKAVTNETIERFHVVVASLATKESAVVFCKYLKENSFSEAHVLEPIKTYRIAIQSFSDKLEAIQFMEKLRKTDSRFETAWVLCN
jgi:hypothetical protein